MTRLDKILNSIPVDVVEAMQASTESELKSLIVASEQAIAESRQQLEDNPAYQKAREDVKACTLGYKDLKKYQGAKIQYALVLLSDMTEKEI